MCQSTRACCCVCRRCWCHDCCCCCPWLLSRRFLLFGFAIVSAPAPGLAYRARRAPGSSRTRSGTARARSGHKQVRLLQAARTLICCCIYTYPFKEFISDRSTVSGRSTHAPRSTRITMYTVAIISFRDYNIRHSSSQPAYTAAAGQGRGAAGRRGGPRDSPLLVLTVAANHPQAGSPAPHAPTDTQHASSGRSTGAMEQRIYRGCGQAAAGTVCVSSCAWAQASCARRSMGRAPCMRMLVRVRAPEAALLVKVKLCNSGCQAGGAARDVSARAGQRRGWGPGPAVGFGRPARGGAGARAPRPRQRGGRVRVRPARLAGAAVASAAGALGGDVRSQKGSVIM